MKYFISTLMVFALLIGVNQTSKACTNYLITKGASADKSVMISYAADSHTLYGELYHWSAQKYAAGTLLDIYEWDTGKRLGQIPQASETYNVVGNMNQWQVSIGETTFTGLDTLGSQTGAIMDYGSLIYIALQRSKSAREAIKIMTDLVAEYGYASTGESFSIADKNEVWIMEMIGKGEGKKGAVWVALLVPDGYVCSHANQARITTFSYQKKNNFFDPKATCFNSPDVIKFAREMNLFKGKDVDFSFSDTYAPVDFGAARFSEIRVYSMFHKVSAEIKNNPKYWEYVKGNIEHAGENHYASNRMPLWVKPDFKVSVHDMFMFMRDHLEGTELDMSKDMGAGPFGNPYRWRPLTWKSGEHTYCNERATATQQTGFSFIAQSRSELPDAIGGILWFSVDDAASTVYTPIYSSSTRAPEKYKRGYGSMMEFVPDAAFWVFNQVSNLAYTRYDSIHKEIAVKQSELELSYIDQVLKVDQKALGIYNQNPTDGIAYLTDYSCSTADNLVANWQRFYGELFVKYMDGNIKYKKAVPADYKYIAPTVKQPGYGEKWYKKIVDETGDQFLYKGSSH